MTGFAVSILVVLVAVGMHYEGLRICSLLLGRLPARQRFGVALAIVGALIAHMLEILLFAIAIAGMISAGLGRLEPAHQSFEDLLYFSAVTYTSLGLGDVIPVGPMRQLAGLESLTGLVMIAWTASFSFVQMKHFWGER